MILCDIGNSTFHFLINGEHKKYFINEALPTFEDPIYFVSVNENATLKLKLSCEELIDIKDLISFKTIYVGMGLDRIIACSGYDDAIIVDAGSAITVDIMSEGEHEGGFILPGLRNFEKIYPQISSKLDFEISLKVNLDKIPLNTKDAISYSILKSIILPIKEIAKNKRVIFTGGDGKFLSQYFEHSVYKEDLIFENMRGIIDANNRIA